MRELARLLVVAASLLAVRTASAQTIVGRVVLADSTTPLPGAIVIASNQQDVDVGRAFTGDSGQFEARLSAPGRYRLRVLRIGFRPVWSDWIEVARDASRRVKILITDQTPTPTLDTVRVVGDRALFGLARHDEFELRHLNRLATASFSRTDIQKRNPVDIWQLLTSVPSIRIIDSAGVTAESTRSFRPTPNLSLEKCYLLILVDGMAMNASPGQKAFDLRLLPKPDEVYGVEVFAGPSSIPLKYLRAGDGSWCGAIAVWTR